MESVVQGQTEVQTSFWDHVNGGGLPADEVMAARKKELQYFVKMQVYTKVSIDECWKVTGKPPIKPRWIDTRKGNGEVRSRLVAKEYKTDNRPDLFSPTPLLKTLKFLISLVASITILSVMVDSAPTAHVGISANSLLMFCRSLCILPQ